MLVQPVVMPLEERLRADSSGALQQGLVRQLESLRDDLLARRRALQPREVQRELQAALKATEAALSVLSELQVPSVHLPSHHQRSSS